MSSMFASSATQLPVVLVTVVVGILTTYLLSNLWQWYRLRHIPGPFLASVSIFWMLRKVLGGRYHYEFKNIAEKYGPLVRVGPNELLSTDPEIIRRMNAVRSPYRKGQFYEMGRTNPPQDNVVSLRDEQEHKALRGKMGTAYSAKENEKFSFEPGIDRQVLKLVNLIETKYISTARETRPLDFAQKAQFFALDVIGDISFEGAFGFLTEDKDLYDYLKIHDSSLPVMNFLSTMPWLTNVLHRWPLKLMMPSDGDNVGFGRLMGLVKGMIEKRLKPGAKPGKDMLQAFINNGMTRDELIQHSFVQIIAGSLSSSTAIRMILLCLISTPTVYTKLRKEIDTGFAAGKISSPITDQEARSSPYLQAVILEGLRMYPPVTGQGSKEVPKGGDIMNGYFVPGGTQVSQNFSGLMNMKDVWGEDADVYKPERWLGCDEEYVKIMKGVVDLAFGFGKYQCLGKPIALMELNKIFVELIRRYDFAIINPANPLRTDSAVFWAINDFWLRVTRRD